MAPRAIVAYIDFVENYYWRLEDQLFLEPEMDELSRHLRDTISRPLRRFYLEGMSRKFIEFAEQIVDGDYKNTGVLPPGAFVSYDLCIQHQLQSRIHRRMESSHLLQCRIFSI